MTTQLKEFLGKFQDGLKSVEGNLHSVMDELSVINKTVDGAAAKVRATAKGVDKDSGTGKSSTIQGEVAQILTRRGCALF